MGFLLVFGIPGLLFFTIRYGQSSSYPDVVAALPLLIAFVGVPVIQWIFPYQLRPMSKKVWNSTPWQIYDRVFPVLCLAAQLTMLYFALTFWGSEELSLWGRCAHLLATGIFGAFFAINVGHELIHRQRRLDRFLGGVLLSTVCFGAFKIVHVNIHHPLVGTPLDFASARRGQSIYSFWMRSFVGNFFEAFKCERVRLAKSGKRVWRSELITWYMFSLLWLALAWMVWGKIGCIFFLLQSLIAILQLDAINYLQHYGLTRKADEGGQFEPVDTHHSWSDGKFLYGLLLLNLFRHGEHHVYPGRAYPLLGPPDEMPGYPYNYTVMFLLLLVPQWFQSVVHPHLDHFQAQTNVHTD